MKKYLAILILLFFGYYLMMSFMQIDFGRADLRLGVASQYIAASLKTNKVANVITSIVVNFRGFDTLGEVTVLFLASTGLASILYRRKKPGVKVPKARIMTSASHLLHIGAKILFPITIVLGTYIFVHGHLTPGGGFQGGAVIATGFLLMLLSYRKFGVSHNAISWVESIAGITFVMIGFTGLILGTSFLENFISVGTLNSLISGGAIPLIYIAVGFKVGAELIGLLDNILLNNKELEQ